MTEAITLSRMRIAVMRLFLDHSVRRVTEAGSNWRDL
jgi:hypothetical protein